MSQGDAYSLFVASELTAENSRRADINSQSTQTITASGAQFAIVAAVVVFLRGKDYVAQGHWGAWAVGVALAMYLASVSMGLVASRSHRTPVTSAKTLTHMLTDHWTDDDITAKNVVAVAQSQQIPKLREGNNIKAGWLKRSLLCQVLGILGLLVGAVALFV